MNDLTLLFSQRIPWDRGFLQRVTDRIEYDRSGSPALGTTDQHQSTTPRPTTGDRDEGEA